MNEKMKGTLLTLIAGVAWGLSGVSGQFVMARGVNVECLTVLRLVLSGIVLLALAVYQNPQQLKNLLTDKKALIRLLLFSIFGLVLNQVAYLTAIYHSNAGTATVLQYLCPILVLVYVCLRRGQKPTVVEVAAIFLAIIGTFLIATHGQIHQLAVTPKGLFWGLFSAVTYALYILLPTTIIKQYGSLTVMGISMLLGSIEAGLFFQPWKYAMPFNGEIFWGLVGIVGVGTIFAYTAFLKGVSMVGQVNGSLLASIEPISSIFFAVLVVNETFYPMDWVGMVLILFAVLLISVKDMVLVRQKGKIRPLKE
ncbi:MULTISPECIES: DMT family transporter [unclassified Streptococcus]|uniref:DMT family transporter n=1 Tax=unclassified Streptococcus TaxID=2608887 RepID=UPI001071DDE4|nr:MULTISPECIES: EamA family transporter [unclassified Streptococcus]MBF0787835.1 EamA family transporter [Streptococcus sp. 19428wC2_LYSM12]MCQ9211191.1 EamA family transporter [Streptococcus sp. B01]MCQ9214466.1 EamA family transporter [Streptococcus sp. O1]TFV05158.1 EamA family transporter [Streptococcus sp. LYSM12]